MRTKYCPYCGSQKIHRLEDEEGIYECAECHNHWRSSEAESVKEHPDSV